MGVVYNDILACAEKLMEASNCEADYRAVVGRSYYSTYHFALCFHNSLKSPGQEPPEDVKGVHERLIYRLNNPGTSDQEQRKKSRLVGLKLKNLKISRVNADYYLSEMDISKEIAELAILNAKDAQSITC